ncbi:hypothetical protein NMY22_g19249 [Coprinellus aureogranulatus]|nr:hypothetical protein NMY22_g19249 [Coprinellus aureogranulatus]
MIETALYQLRRRACSETFYGNFCGGAYHRGSGSSAATKLPNEGVFKAAIIGGSISGTVVVVAIVLLLIHRARRRRRQRDGDRLTLGVPSTYAGSTRKLSLPFWPHNPAGDDSASGFQNLTPLPQKRRSGSSYAASPYQEKYEPEYTPSPGGTKAQLEAQYHSRERASILSPAKALMESFYPAQSRRGSATTGKLSRLEDSMSPTSTFPPKLSRFSDIRGRQDTPAATGTISSSNHVLPMQAPPSPAAPREYI